MTTLAQTISDITERHLNGGGLLFGQCLTAVGRVGGTIPNMQECIDPVNSGGIVELPTCDVAGPGFVVGVALAGRRPIFVCRYQGFMTYNLSTIVNYAAKSKAMWGVPCPIFVRAIAMEGGIGPVASGSHHSMAMRMPGMRVFAPMTPGEWAAVWEEFIDNSDPVYCSEHRLSFQSAEEMPGIYYKNPDVVLFGISAGRLSALKASELLAKRGVAANVIHVINLKPFSLWPNPQGWSGKCDAADYVPPCGGLDLAKFGIVVDSDFGICGAAEHVAHKLMLATGKRVVAMGLDDKTAGFAPHLDNKTPTPENIVDKVVKYLR